MLGFNKNMYHVKCAFMEKELWVNLYTFKASYFYLIWLDNDSIYMYTVFELFLHQDDDDEMMTMISKKE